MTPQKPHELFQHPCIGYRFTQGEPYHRKFEKGDELPTMQVKGPPVVGEPGLRAWDALDGVELA